MELELKLGRRITVDRHTSFDRYVSGIVIKLWSNYVRIQFDNGGHGTYNVNEVVR